MCGTARRAGAAGFTGSSPDPLGGPRTSMAMSYSEIHFHLLPGVDDGPPSLEQSLELAQLAVADGTRTIVATPHVHPLHVTDPSEIRDRVLELDARLRAARIPIEV